MPRILLVRPDNDGPEQLMSELWAEPIADRMASDDAVVFVDVPRPIDRAASDAVLGPEQGVVYFGHGTSHALGDNPVLIDANNVGQAAGGVVLAFACHSLLNLADSAVAQGVKAYMGFDDWLIIYPQPASASAAAVFEAVVDAMLGQPMGQVCDQLGAQLTSIFDHYALEAGRQDPDAGIIISTVRLMARALGMRGKEDACLVQ